MKTDLQRHTAAIYTAAQEMERYHPRLAEHLREAAATMATMERDLGAALELIALLKDKYPHIFNDSKQV